MSEATAEMRALLGEQMFEQTQDTTEKLQSLFGEPFPSEDKAATWLQKRGFTLLQDGFFLKPPGKGVSDDEWFILQFLIEAYGYGGMRFKL